MRAVLDDEGEARVAIAAALGIQKSAVFALPLGKRHQPGIEILDLAKAAIGVFERAHAGLGGELGAQGLLFGQRQKNAGCYSLCG